MDGENKVPNPIKMDDLGVPFWKHPYHSYILDAARGMKISSQAYGTAVHEGKNVIKYGPGGAKAMTLGGWCFSENRTTPSNT